MKTLIHLPIALILVPSVAFAQNVTLKGTVMDEQEQPMPGVTIHIPEIKEGDISDKAGEYIIEDIPAGTYEVIASFLGYNQSSRQITLGGSEVHTAHFTLQEDITELDEVLVVGKTQIEEIKEQPYNLNVIDADPLQNSNQDVGQILGRVTGINVRKEGGMGADFDFSIHGFNGNQVKFFINGVPMDNYGDALSINDISVNLIERIEVYKGVVPIKLGADALGGAVNIITKQNVNHYLDASYSYGSFNTHRFAFNGKYTFKNTGISLKMAAFYNYSDNDYHIDIDIPDALGNYDGKTTTVQRFHDSYRSGMAQMKVGVEDKPYADRLYFGLTKANNHNNVQHGQSLERVFGQVFTTDEVLIPSVEYQQSNFLFQGLSLRSHTSFIDGKSMVVDTSSREYDWYGNYTIKNNPNIAEAQWEKTMFSFNDQTLISTNNVTYKFNNKHGLDFNYTLNRFRRVGKDPLDPNIVPFSDPNYLHKNVLGLGYNSNWLDDKVSTTLFLKYFNFHGKAIDVDWDNKKTAHHTSFSEPGFGFAVNYYLNEHIQTKASFESTYRLPEGYEMFGDGLLINNNPILQPEQSDNLNLGVRFRKVQSNDRIAAETNFFYRDAENLIRQQATGVQSQYVNLSKASTSGMEASVDYSLKKWFTVDANITYQNIINKTKYDGNRLSTVYLDRIPNIPYLYGNLGINFKFYDLLLANDRFGTRWYSRYIHEYYLKWPSKGDPDHKHVIPEQIMHNLELNYSIQNGTYNIALGSTNLMDSKVYDKFRIQKPGRALYFKLRYFIEN